MNGRALRVARYRFRATFGRRWSAYLTLVLLIGLIGGVAMGALAAARRTESSFPTFLASTNPSDLSLGTALLDPALGYTNGYDAALVRTISGLPHVRRAESFSDVYSTPLAPDGEPTKAAQTINMNVEGSVDGLYFNQDRVTVVQGRMADPKRADEIVMTVGAASQLGLHVGQTAPWGTYANSQFSTAGTGPPPKPALHENLTLVGTVVLNNAVVQDDVDANSSVTVIFTPALTRRLVNCCSNFAFTYLQLDHGSRDVPAVESEIERVVPSVLPYDFYDTSIDVTKAQNSIKPEAIALGVFGLIAALAALLIAGQVIGRQLGFWAPEERDPARARRQPRRRPRATDCSGSWRPSSSARCWPGASPWRSHRWPRSGPCVPYYPHPGVAFDWTVLGFGVLALIVVLGAVAVVLARAARTAAAPAGWRTRPRSPSRVAGAAASAGLPVSAVAGIRFALEPGAETEAVPVRSAILGATLTVVVVIATVVFGASFELSRLAPQPLRLELGLRARGRRRGG